MAVNDREDTFWEQYGHFVGCTVRESNSAVGIVTGVTNEDGPMLHIRRKNGKIDRRKPSDVHKTCACGKRALDSNGKVCPGHENCKPLASAPPEPEDCREPHEDGPLNYCPTCSWSRRPASTKATDACQYCGYTEGHNAVCSAVELERLRLMEQRIRTVLEWPSFTSSYDSDCCRKAYSDGEDDFAGVVAAIVDGKEPKRDA